MADFIIESPSPTTFEIDSPSPTTFEIDYKNDFVHSVNGKEGYVVLTKSDLGLGNVDNTSDLNKPVSTATQAALDAQLAYILNRFKMHLADIGDGVSTSYTITHNLGTRDVIVQMYSNTDPYDMPIVYIARTTINTVNIDFHVAPTANAYRVIIAKMT